MRLVPATLIQQDCLQKPPKSSASANVRFTARPCAAHPGRAGSPFRGAESLSEGEAQGTGIAPRGCRPAGTAGRRDSPLPTARWHRAGRGPTAASPRGSRPGPAPLCLVTLFPNMRVTAHVPSQHTGQE